ncbi:MAG: hypothetical protein HOI05_00920 [Nitrosopumilus sp.]|mgnify:FL=1|nr:hypothetical protein [Nitrosopumilus sp.]MBT5278591.1 hypothetical protein [Nitrosopumilus sp.]MBT6194369.1 hypothetical protein [Nitrosopumilus sp.]
MDKKNKKEEEKPKKNNLKAFLKKRAPLYLAGIALIVISVNGVLTEKHLGDFLIDFSEEEQIVVDILMQYNGPNESGLNVKDAIENKINEKYPDEKIFDDRNTRIQVDVTNINLEEYQVVLNFKGDKGEMIYDWNVNIDSKEIKSNNQESKHIINIVDFYD